MGRVAHALGGSTAMTVANDRGFGTNAVGGVSDRFRSWSRMIGLGGWLIVLGAVPGYSLDLPAITQEVLNKMQFSVTPNFVGSSLWTVNTYEDVGDITVVPVWQDTSLFSDISTLVDAIPSQNHYLNGDLNPITQAFMPYRIVPWPDPTTFLTNGASIDSGACIPDEDNPCTRGHGDPLHAPIFAVNNNGWPMVISTVEPGHEVLSPHLNANWPYILDGDAWAAYVPDRAVQTGHDCTSPSCPNHVDQPGFDCHSDVDPDGNPIDVHRNPPYPCWNLNPLRAQLLSPPGTPWVTGVESDLNMARNYLHINFRDRTPPIICDAAGNPCTIRLPPVNKPPLQPALTGDYSKIQGIKLKDNSKSRIWSLFAVNRVGVGGGWKWTTDPPTPAESEHDCEPAHVCIPNDVFGKNEYALFCWDGRKNLNPSQKEVQENQPTNGYNVGYGAKPARNLNQDPLEPQDFHLKYPTDCDLNAGQVTAGDLWVDDNDFPNVMIQMVNTRDRATLGSSKFAYCVPLPTDDIISADPVAWQEMAGSCMLDYGQYQCATVASMIFPLLVDLGNSAAAISNMGTEHTGGQQALLADDVFFRGQFRLEKYSRSDSRPDGTMINDDLTTIGERHGTGKSMTLYHSDPLIEDIEYELFVYAEDNVKEAREPNEVRAAGTIGYSVGPTISGIWRIQIEVAVPNQNPPAAYSWQFQEANAWDKVRHGPFRVIFREPTPSSGPYLATLVSNRNPWVRVSATDLAGNTREMKVFFPVNDQKSAMRILEQRYPKNR